MVVLCSDWPHSHLENVFQTKSMCFFKRRIDCWVGLWTQDIAHGPFCVIHPSDYRATTVIFSSSIENKEQCTPHERSNESLWIITRHSCLEDRPWLVSSVIYWCLSRFCLQLPFKIYAFHSILPSKHVIHRISVNDVKSFTWTTLRHTAGLR